MKIKTRIIVSFFIIIFLPLLLSGLLLRISLSYQLSNIEQTYGISDATLSSLSNSATLLSQVSEVAFSELEDLIEENPDQLEDAAKLVAINEELNTKESYLLVRKDWTVTYIGTDSEQADTVIRHLPAYGDMESTSENGYYIGGSAKVLLRQIDFQYSDGTDGSAFIVTDVGEAIPQVREILYDTVIILLLVLIFTAFCCFFWIYRGIIRPINKMKAATKYIKEGNLDFELIPEADDELGQLTDDLEDMRKKLKESAEEKVTDDSKSKELISNISHDLKTPVTTIKGYAEGILDGVADTPEKVERYVRTIYNKANEMDALINELTLYSKIDTNKIPYNFNILPAVAYFDDCGEELALDMEGKHVDFSYMNYVERDVKFIADPEQLRRVINNIVGNSLKYMDKDRPRISLRVKDVGDFIQVEIEDNGKGISQKDLPQIFDRFYRTDSSRNSSKGGSGIGLSVVKKIVEEHGGKVWATSREGVGTTMYFVLRKYQEVPADE